MDEETSLSRQLERLKAENGKNVFHFLNYCGWKIVEGIPHNCLISCQCSEVARNNLKSDKGQRQIKDKQETSSTNSDENEVNCDVINETDASSSDVMNTLDVEDESRFCLECNPHGNSEKEHVTGAYRTFNLERGEETSFMNDIINNSINAERTHIVPLRSVSKGGSISEKNNSDRDRDGEFHVNAWTGNNERSNFDWSHGAISRSGHDLLDKDHGIHHDGTHGNIGGHGINSSTSGHGASGGYGVESFSYGHDASGSYGVERTSSGHGGYRVENSGSGTSVGYCVGETSGGIDNYWGGSSGASGEYGTSGWDGGDSVGDTYGGGGGE